VKHLLRKLACYFLGHRHIAASFGFAKLLGAETCDRCGHTQYATSPVYRGINRTSEYWETKK
jgi:hypothetical protein